MQDDASTNTLICEDECIYRTTVKDVKNFSFLYHKYEGAPMFIEYYILIHCMNGKFQKNIKLGMNSYNCFDDKMSFDMKEIGENKFVLVKGDEEKGIEKINVNSFGENKKDVKKKKIMREKLYSESDSDSKEEEQKNKKQKKRKKGKE